MMLQRQGTIQGTGFENSDDISKQQLFLSYVQRLLLELKFIQELDPAVQSKVAELLTYESKPKNAVLFREGSLPDSAYILLEGQLEVYTDQVVDHTWPVNHDNNNEGTLTAEKYCEAIVNMVKAQKRRSSMTLPVKIKNSRASAIGQAPVDGQLERQASPNSEAGSTHEEHKKEGYPGEFGQLIAIISTGTMIGERGLLEDDARNATVVCKRNCEFLVFTRVDFDRTVKTQLLKVKAKQYKASKKHLFMELPFFERFASDIRESLPDVMHFARYGQGVFPFRQGDKPDYCYIVLSGTVSVWKKEVANNHDMKMRHAESRALDHIQEGQHANWVSNMNSLKFDDKTAKAARSTVVAKAYIPACLFGTDAAQECCTAITTWMHGKEAYIEKEKKKRLEVEEDSDGVSGDEDEELKDHACVAVLGTGTLFGELALAEEELRFATTVCESDCEFLVIAKKDFDKLVKTLSAQDHIYLPKVVQPIIKEVPFFMRMSRQVLTRVPDILDHASATAGTVLFWEGDDPKRCYLLLSGRAVALKKPDSLRSNAPIRKMESPASLSKKCTELALKLSRSKDIRSNWMHMSTDHHHASPEPDHYEEHLSTDSMKEVGMVPVAEFHPGAVFGEDALVNDKARNATVICASTCQFLIIDHHDFDELLREDVRREKMKQLSFHVRRVLKEFEVFQGLDSELMQTVANLVQYAQAKKGITVFQQGCTPDYCYIVLRGNVAVWKRPDRKAGQHNNLRPTFDQPEIEFADAAHKSTANKCEALAQRLAEATEYATKANVNAYEDSMGLPKGEMVARLGPGMIFGELALRDDRPRDATVTTMSDCEFLKIERSNFDHTIKSALKAADDEKLVFLKAHIPAMKSVPSKTADGVLRFFEKCALPRNHKFLAQGEVSDMSLSILWTGSVECQLHVTREGNGSPKREQNRCIGVLLCGNVFGSVAKDQPAPFSIVATSAPCVVLRVTEEHFKSFPEVLEKNLYELAELTISRRVTKPSGTEKDGFRPNTAPPESLGLPPLNLSVRTPRGKHVKGDAVQAMMNARQAKSVLAEAPSVIAEKPRHCPLRSNPDVDEIVEGGNDNSSVKSRCQLQAKTRNANMRSGYRFDARGESFNGILNTNFAEVNNRPFVNIGTPKAKHKYYAIENTDISMLNASLVSARSR